MAHSSLCSSPTTLTQAEQGRVRRHVVVIVVLAAACAQELQLGARWQHDGGVRRGRQVHDEARVVCGPQPAELSARGGGSLTRAPAECSLRRAPSRESSSSSLGRRFLFSESARRPHVSLCRRGPTGDVQTSPSKLVLPAYPKASWQAATPPGPSFNPGGAHQEAAGESTDGLKMTEH